MDRPYLACFYHWPCPQCQRNRAGIDNEPGHGWYRPIRTKRQHKYKTWELAQMKRPTKSDDGDKRIIPGMGDIFVHLPTLFGYLTEDKWEDGGKRERSTILLFMDGGQAKVWLNDRANKRECWMTGDTADEALLRLEEALKTDEAPWKHKEERKRGRD